LPTEETMRWTLLLIAPALLAGCTQLGDQYDLGNSDSPGGTHGCKVGFSKVWTGQSFEYLCNDGPDVVDIVVPPTVVPPDPKTDPPGGVTPTIDPKSGAISLPEVIAPPDVAYLWISNTSEGSVSKVDAKKLVEAARYRSSRVCSNTSGATAFDDATVCNTFDPKAVNPSRTAIDGDSNAFVANRAFGLQATVSKIGSQTKACIDRNANGVIDTSTSSTIVANDECMLWTVPVGGKKNDAIARALAIGPTVPDNPDTSDAVWVGLYNDKKAVRLRNKDGKTMDTFSLNVNTYGAAIDGAGRAWYVGRGPSAVQYVRPPPCSGGGCVSPLFSIPAAVLKCPATSGPYLYGIAVDTRGRVYAQGAECNQTYQFTPDAGPAPTAGTWRKIYLPTVNQGRGVAVQVFEEDFNGTKRKRNRIWVTNYDQWAWGAWAKSYATSFDGDKLACDRDADGILDSVDPDIENTGNPALGIADKKNTCDYNGDKVVNELDADVTYFQLPNVLANSPVGIGVDPLDSKFIWTANQDGYVTRIDSTSSPLAPVTVKVKVGPDPYTYSDFTGSAHANITSRYGRARTIYAGGCADGKNARWTELAWTADVPIDTKIIFHLRIADQDYNKDGKIDVNDASAAPQIPVMAGWEQSNTSANPKPPIVINNSPVNLTALNLPATAFAQIDIDLFSSAEKSPVVKTLDLKRTCD
jgi:hypothetical protein